MKGLDLGTMDDRYEEGVQQDASLKAVALRVMASRRMDREKSRNNFLHKNMSMKSKSSTSSIPKLEFKRVQIVGSNGYEIDGDTKIACELLNSSLAQRDKYMSIGPSRPEEGHITESEMKVDTDETAAAINASEFREEDFIVDEYGEYHPRLPPPKYDPFHIDNIPVTNHLMICQRGIYSAVNSNEHCDASLNNIPSVNEYFADLKKLMRVVGSGPCVSLSYKRLQLLEAKFNLHIMLNSDAELLLQKRVPHRDFYNIRKVDTHVHHSACMNQKHLLRFIKKKLKTSPNEIVSFRDGLFMTLTEVFESLRMTAYDLSVDTLDMHADNTFHRFDRFNLKYNPAGQSRLREIFLKTDNLIGGEFLAEVTHEVISDLAESKYSMVEWRLSIYGRQMSEWDKLARWFYVNRLAHFNVRWMIQVPRLYGIYKKTGEVDCFQDMIDRIFKPLFEVTIDPESNLPLHIFLKTIVGFDSVDDESKLEPIQIRPDEHIPSPGEWDNIENPPYSYWSYFLWANITSLNSLRASKGFNTFEFRPHCGEAGDIEHMAAAFLVSDKINHGIQLRKSPVLQYLFYLRQIGIAMSPLSNNRLFLDYSKNPFPKYFAQGMNVSLSTDDPLLLHYTKDALLEEYSAAVQVWKLSAVDQCEIARNSVLQSGFEPRFKKHFIGETYAQSGAAGNTISKSNVPDIRLAFRHESLQSELEFVKSGGIDLPIGS
mmetsp:Transcript_17825/g.25219  ORF Transcript_17825/g.25219 Transcript_17825/m.25219 type:complete len:712 (-) Transcript_17825:130-2265(-)|eukprot:CAMPEP_0171459258 /NCGR_PEP_ID=MMETSP0945-20130129/4611_1 /TAXON_ID=109269 /ORGANISM="Vaucheria litorea, Strain CCMP2940" /LENGTH=711 /DNA_ID=CAMNT_0011985235 /DNA_START=22 /DNA_END=2157 /DNA_ORIENTATION=-